MSGKEPAIVTGDKESLDTWRQALIEVEKPTWSYLRLYLSDDTILNAPG